MQRNIIIAIDGYSSCGKSTLAQDLAAELGYTYVDTGAMYRAVTLHFLNHNVDIHDPAAIEEALLGLEVSFQREDSQQLTMLNGQVVEDEIRQMRVSKLVSPVSAIKAVRRELVRQQQQMGRDKAIVMDGRDIGTVVFPEAELKLFVTADPEVRTTRRHEELLERGLEIDREEVAQNLRERDHLDSTRKESPLRQAEDAIVIDNSDMTPQQQLELALNLARKVIERIGFRQ